MGTENKDRNRGDALLKVEANTLAVCAGFVCVYKMWVRVGVGFGKWDD